MVVVTVVAIDMESFSKIQDEKHQGEKIDYEVRRAMLAVSLERSSIS